MYSDHLRLVELHRQEDLYNMPIELILKIYMNKREILERVDKTKCLLLKSYFVDD